jgi:hypothetical protein
MNGQQIYDNFHTDANGTAGLQDAQDGAQSVAQSFQQRADTVQRLMDSVGQGWQGNAADHATAAMTPLAVNFNEGGDDLSKTQDLVSRQVESFHTAAAKVQPMPPQPQLQDPMTALSTGQGLQPYLNQAVHYSATAQNNVDAMTGYHGASTYNTENLPPVEPALQSSAVPIAVDTTRPSASSGSSSGATGSRPAASSGASSAPRTRVGMPNTAGATPSPNMPGRRSGQPVATGQSANPPGQPVTVASGAGPGGAAGTPPGGVGGGGTGSPGSGAIPGGGVGGGDGGVPIGFTEPLPGSGTPGSGLGRGVSQPPGGNMPGENPLGEPAPFGSGPSGAGGAAGEQGPGSRSVVGEPGAVADEGNLLARGASSETGGVGAPGLVGGRGARGGEDDEHKRKYKYDEDPEIFSGDLPRVARPVIGEM